MPIQPEDQGEFQALLTRVRHMEQDRIGAERARLDAAPAAIGAVRALNETFQPHETRPVLALYTVELAVNANSGTVELRIAPESPPLTVQTEAYLESAVLLGLVQIATTARQVLPGFVPPGHYVRLSSAGAGTKTLVSALELVL